MATRYRDGASSSWWLVGALSIAGLVAVLLWMAGQFAAPISTTSDVLGDDSTVSAIPVASEPPAVQSGAVTPGFEVAAIQATLNVPAASSTVSVAQAIPTTVATAATVPTMPIATATAVPTVPPATVQPTPRVVLDERFADNRQGWPNDPNSTAWLADGGYRLFARVAARFVAVGAPNTGLLRDVTLSGTFRKVGGPPGGGYGFVVRDQSEHGRDGVNQSGRFYVLEAGDRGELGIWRRDGDRWIDLVPWKPSDVVRTGNAPNEITVKATGDQLVFLINGVEVARETDSVLKEGSVGVFVGGDGNEVMLQSLRIESAE